MGLTVIVWRLRDIMDDHGIAAGDLAEAMKVSSNAVSLWRKPRMPKIDGERLNELLIQVNRLRKKGSPVITSSDLIKTTFTSEELEAVGYTR